jgi:hypothetical protein
VFEQTPIDQSKTLYASLLSSIATKTRISARNSEVPHFISMAALEPLMACEEPRMQVHVPSMM